MIDISENNGYIDFTKVKQDGIEKAILRVGWIGNKNNHTIDKYFNDYYSRCKENNIKIGIYVYSYCKSTTAMISACNWIFEKIKDKYIDLPIFLDLEDSSIIGTDINNQAEYFCNFFKQKGYDVGIYANKYWFNNYIDIQKFLDNKIWLAEWNGKENHTFKYKVDLWQYTDKGKINGITGKVDISKCLCNCDDSTNNDGGFDMPKIYKNGSTIEKVYAESNCKTQIGMLNRYEQCECIGIQNNRYIVKYKIDGTNNYKVGFVKYDGGVK